MPENFAGLRDIPLKPEDSDALGVLRYATALAEFVRECQTPMTIGIQGDWGSGKTSLMNLVEGNLQRARPVIPCVTLNMWQYAQQTDSTALPYVVLAALMRQLKPEKGPAGKVAGWLKNRLEGVGTVKLEFMGAGVEFNRSDAEGTPADIEDVKKLMGEMVETRTRLAGTDRMVVFIDDLDRILPLRAVELLEVLKNFVDVPGCIFVLACDYQVVVKGLKKRFDVSEDDLGGRSFFDKIIQVPFRMPVHRYDVHNFVKEILRNINWPHSDADLEKYTAMLAHSIGFNPRSLKRTGNTLLLIRKVAQLDADEQMRRALDDPNRLKVLFGLCCMEASFEAAFGLLSKVAEEDRKTLQNLLLKPGDALQDDTWKTVIESSGQDDMATRLESFLEVLGQVVDADGSDEIDENEARVLSEMLKLTAITSVEVGGGGRAPNRSTDELIDLASQHGTTVIVERLRQSLGTVLRERRTRTTFSFDMRFRVDKRWSTRSCVAVHVRSGRAATCQVWICITRLRELAHEQGASTEAVDELAAFVREHYLGTDLVRDVDNDFHLEILVSDDERLPRLSALFEALPRSP